MIKTQTDFQIEVNSFLDSLMDIIENIKGYNTVKSDIMRGSYESFIIWTFYVIIAFIQIIFIFYLLWLILKRQIFDPDFSDKRNLRKSILGIIIISLIQYLSNIPLFYPLIEIPFPFI